MAIRSYWTNRSVQLLAQGRDPVEVVLARARSVVLQAIESGWQGPPYDPFALAEMRGIRAIPSGDIRDASLVPLQNGGFQILFNPNRPRSRTRYSVAHEIAHTLFPDCDQDVRDRIARTETTNDAWQLEMLCNLAAAEILMPIGTVQCLKDEPASIDRVLALRREHEVSVESVLLRLVKICRSPCAIFAASRKGDREQDPYRLDYAIGSSNWGVRLFSDTILPKQSVVTQCVAIGYTAKGIEQWPRLNHAFNVECVGVQPYPGCRFPRVLGVLNPPDPSMQTKTPITYLRGDATSPRGNGHRILAHVVNDKAALWGAGFGLVVRKKWPLVQQEFVAWASNDRRHLALGNTQFARADAHLTICHMICQRGYGPAKSPRIRYSAMASCLDKLAEFASHTQASVHMPRIGCGEAGGSWGIIGELVEDKLCRRGLEVTVYDLPGAADRAVPPDPTLFGR